MPELWSIVPVSCLARKRINLSRILVVGHPVLVAQTVHDSPATRVPAEQL